MNIETCKTCKFWEQFPSDVDSGNCRRYPPTFSNHGDASDIYSTSEFPCTYASAWCGEWKEQKEPETK